jgi:signal peptidase I
LSRWSDPFQRLLREYAESLLFAFLVALTIRLFLFTPYAITTPTMAPVLEPGDFVLAYRLPYGVRIFGWQLGGRNPQVDEVVVFSCPNNSRHACIKRVVGVPGDRIEIQRGQLIRNAAVRRPLNGTPDFGPVVVPPESVFVLSEAAGGGGADSRTLGVVPAASVEAKVLGVWWSLDWDPTRFWPTVRWSRVFLAVH